MSKKSKAKKNGKSTKAVKAAKTKASTSAAKTVASDKAKASAAPSKGNGASKAKAAKAKASKGPKRVSALDAAAQVLAKVGKPMRSQELIAAMAEQGLWQSPGGKTPHATLYSAMTREITIAGKDSRFKKVDRGQFAFNKESK
jgi:hypothetical protein